MATSTNYGWAEPDDSSLVKNGAADMRTLGNAIDTSVWNSGFGQAGKNKFINGNFGIWQRGTSFAAAAGIYTADRWFYSSDGAAGATVSRQAFTPGTAPVAGYEGQYFYRYARTSGTTTYNQLYQPIEDVQTFAGQTVTFSFWAKADAATTITMDGYQLFGTGGGSPVSMGLSGTASLTTSWQRFSFTASVPSMAGRTIGTGSALRPMINYGTGNKVVDVWGCQIEYGSKATPFQTASGGSPQAELAMCQRYYYRVGGAAAYETFAFGVSSNTTNGYFALPYKSTLRTLPSAVEYASIELTDPGTGSFAVTSMVIDNSGTNQMSLNATTAGILIAKRPYFLRAAGTTNGYIAFSAEL